MKLSIVIPAYNESRTIVRMLDLVRSVQLIEGVTKQVIVVNDCSKDGTLEALNAYQAAHPEFPLDIESHPVNRGKGAALHTGIARANGDFTVIQDADMEYDPNEFNLLLKPLLSDRADVVYGSRFMGGRPHRILFFWHSIGNGILTFISNAFTNLNLSDMETCYKMFRTPMLQALPLRECRFGFEPEVTAKISRVRDVRIFEVGISYYGRTYAEGKKIGWKDGVAAIWCILKYNIWAR